MKCRKRDKKHYEITPIVVAIGEILVDFILGNIPREQFIYGTEYKITYEELCTELKIKKQYVIEPINLRIPLGALSHTCKDIRFKLPLLSSIVVNKDTKIPGQGYFNEFFDGVEYALASIRWEKEYKAIRLNTNREKWIVFLEYLKDTQKL